MDSQINSALFLLFGFKLLETKLCNYSALSSGGGRDCFLTDNKDGNIASVSGSDKKISALELVYLGMGSVIGSSFFLGSGIAVEKAGPSVVLGYVIGGAICYLVLLCLGHLALRYRNRESFRGYVQEAVGPGAGFVVGWSAWLTSITSIIAEAVAMATYTRVWLPHLPLWVLVISFIILAVAINLYGITIVDWSEGLMSVLKTGALAAFVLVVFFFVFHSRGGYAALGPANLTPFFPRGIGGMAQAAVICTFAYGIGAFAVATGDTRNPQKDVPRAVLGMALGQGIFFTLPTLALVLAVPWTIISTRSSPFVTALQHLGITAGGSVLNAVVLISSFSVLVASMFSAVVMLSSLAHDWEAPDFLGVRKKNGLAFNALLMSTAAALLLTLAALLLPRNTYNYAVSSTGYLSFVNWGGILVARLNLSLPGRNQGRLEKNGFALSGIALLALLTVSVLGLAAPEQVFSFAFAAAFVLLMVLISRIVAGYRAAGEAGAKR